MSRGSANKFADFFPSAPSVLQQKRKRAGSDRYAEAEPRPQKTTSRSPNIHATSRSSLPSGSREVASLQSNRPLDGLDDDDDISTTRYDDLSLRLTSANSAFDGNHAGKVCSVRQDHHALTPITTHESSPPSKPFSPRSSRTAASQVGTDAYGSTYRVDDVRATNTLTPTATPPQRRTQARPDQGEVCGYKALYDPELDTKISSKERKKLRVRYKTFNNEAGLDIPPDPRLAVAGYTTGAYNAKGQASRSKLRVAPYVMKPYIYDPQLTVGPGPATQIVITGFDPFTPASQLRALFGSFGEIAELRLETDPTTGSFLGIGMIRYRDSRSTRQPAVTAAIAAKRAEKEGTSQRVGVCRVRVERDQEGRKCARYAAAVVKRNRDAQKQAAADAEPVKKEQASAASLQNSGPPPDAPKGPSNSGHWLAEGPRGPGPQRHYAYDVVERESVLEKIKREPYIFIAHCYVPVLASTLPHLRRKLKTHVWRDVKVDTTGYYIIFEDSWHGRNEASNCFRQYHMAMLFNYSMNMEFHRHGNPQHERTPSPATAAEEERRENARQQAQRDEENDLDEEKKQRALDLDPVRAALDVLTAELRDRVMADIKERIAAPTLYDCMCPEKHATKRRKLGISDTAPSGQHQPSALFLRGDHMLSSGALDGRHGDSITFRRPLAAHDANINRQRKQDRTKPHNVFADERRKNSARKRVDVRPLHHRLQNFFDDDEGSGEDEHSTVKEDEEKLSEPPPTLRTRSPSIEESKDEFPVRRRKVLGEEPGWGHESDDESLDAVSRRLLGDLVKKVPGDMAQRELEQVVSIAPRFSKLHKLAKAELQVRQTAQVDDESIKISVEKSMLEDITILEECSGAGERTEPEAHLDADQSFLKVPAKTKARKRKAKKAVHVDEPEIDGEGVVEIATECESGTLPTPSPTEDNETEEVQPGIEWTLSSTEPKRTVEDDHDIVLDVDGWQNLVKDEEDLALLKRALAGVSRATIGDAYVWAWRQKKMKVLNNGGVKGLVYNEPRIEGYFVQNETGCVRTEGVKKIVECEKSKYLPHRIKVQKAREEREAEAKKNPADAAKLHAIAKLNLASSRSQRANTRRLVNDMNTQKAVLSYVEGEAMRFNQLKKRKKLVKFDRSAIHNWGLYAEEDIAGNDMIIEYVGEKIRQQVANLREQRYLKQGIGSSYLFRIDEDTVIDATKKGGIARFINHSCTPNCTAKIIKVEGTKRIVIYALRDIGKNEELTYDYKFEREINSDDRIPCLCGSIGCKGFLN